ncbi:hypothetical protein ACFWBH_24695 [Streptomyces sp. NPDC059999]|uniref:hypothetical protein n=1 Tax=Streptomyces sp. NPDC059999 TaxID=3347030 RepID=UPI00367C527A
MIQFLNSTWPSDGKPPSRRSPASWTPTRARGPGSLDRGARAITEIHRLLPEAATPDKDQIRRSDPQGALDTTARAILGACFHNSVRPDPADGETARRRYADERGDMAIAYLLALDRQGTVHT